MTFQPPPPPPGGNPPTPPPPPPPPPGQWGPPGGGYPTPGNFDPKNVNPLDWGIVGAGVLAFIFSFVSYYTISVHGLGSASENSWHGFFGWFAMLLALAGSAAVAAQLFAPQAKMPWPNRLVGLALYAVATLFVILALFVYPGNVPNVSGVDRGHGVGYWLSLVVIIAGLVLSLMRAQQTNTALPGPLSNLPNIGNKGPQGGIGGSQGTTNPGMMPPGGAPPPPPPPPGYGSPPSP